MSPLGPRSVRATRSAALLFTLAAVLAFAAFPPGDAGAARAALELGPAEASAPAEVAGPVEASALAEGSAPTQTPTADRVFRIPVTGTIELGLAPFIARGLREAQEARAAAVILDLDTPGGRVDAAWEIIDAVRDAEVPVYAYVNRRALSAGAMIGLSARALYMRPGSVIGAATPVTGEGQTASEKMVSAMRSEFRALAEARGFDPRIAEAMVDENVAVPGIVDEGQLLTLTTEEAVRHGVANAEVEGWPELLAAVGVEPGAPAVDLRPNWAENLVRFLTNPMVAPLLLSLGFLGLLVEIKTPTFGLAGGIGLLSLAAFFGARLIVALAGMEEILLFLVGLGLLLAEVFFIPGVGVLAGLGAAAILASLVMSMLGRFPTWTDVLNASGMVALSLLIVGAVFYALLRHLPHSRRMAGIFLQDATGRDIGYVSATRRDDLVGKVGVALTDLRPSGTALVDDERIDVVTEGPWVEARSRVRILRAEGYRHVVRELTDGQPERAELPEPVERPEPLKRPDPGERPDPVERPEAVERPERGQPPEAVEHPEPEA